MKNDVLVPSTAITLLVLEEKKGNMFTKHVLESVRECYREHIRKCVCERVCETFLVIFYVIRVF